MIIQMCGRGDRRVVVYPLLYLLNQLDGALLITDDSAYRRIIPDGGYYVGNVAVQFCVDFSNIKASDYDIIVIDHSQPVPEMESTDEIIWIKRAKLNDEPPLAHHHSVLVDFEHSADKTAGLLLSLPFIREIHNMETTGRLEPIRNHSVIRILAPVFADIIGISAKSVKLMMMKGGSLT